MQEAESILEGQSISDDKFIVIRCDGKGFSKAIAKAHIKLPFDKDFHERMTNTAQKTLEIIFGRGFAYTYSDEISFVLPKKIFDRYGRRTEKLLTLAAGAASGIGSLEFYYLDISPTIFDAKIFEFNTVEEVMEYLSNRKTNCLRNFVFSVARKHYMDLGKTPAQVAKDLNGVKLNTLIERLLKEKIDIYKLPIWQREGVIIYYEPYEKAVKRGAFGTRKMTSVTRRRVKTLKPLRFCSGDEEAIEQLINGEYKGGT